MALWLTVLTWGSPAFAQWMPAADFLRHQVDYAFEQYYVYTDTAMPENHFPVLVYMGPPGMEGAPPITVSTVCTTAPCAGSECIRSEVTHASAGACFQHGYMENGDTVPRPNLGDRPDAATDLTGARHLVFHARGERGGEEVEFFVGGIGRDLAGPQGDGPFPDVPKIAEPKTLTQIWQTFGMVLPDDTKLDHVINGFGWWQRARPNGPSVIYIDDIRYECPRAREPRFPVSFATEDRRDPFDTVQRSFAHTYDSALGLITFLALGDERRARLIGEAFCEAREHDPDGPRIEGALRNCYSAGDLFLPNGWVPTGIPGAVRLAGFWTRLAADGRAVFPSPEAMDDGEWRWFQDQYANAVYVGNIAWAGIALVHLCDRTHEPRYLAAAVALGEWIVKHALGQAGFSGGTKYWADQDGNSTEAHVKWVSTEHNLDCYVLFTLLETRDRDADRARKWSEAAAHARAFVESMWDDGAHHFWTGRKPNGDLNPDFIPVDCQAWAVLALRDPAYSPALDWTVGDCSVQLPEFGLRGFAFRDLSGLPPDHLSRGIWPEGTAQMVCAFRQTQRTADAARYLETLREIQRQLLPQQNGMVAAADEVLEAFPPDEDGKHEYYHRQHVGATCWFILAETGWNPYWLEPMDGGE